MPPTRTSYHHGALRETLLDTTLRLIEGEGIGAVSLAGQLAAARAGAGSPVHALTGLMRAYVGFARREPGYFRLMFRPELSGPQEHAGLKAAERAAGEQLDAAVADCVDKGIVPAGQADVLGVAAWSLAHGLASLWLDGQRHEELDDPERVAAQVAALVESALGKRV